MNLSLKKMIEKEIEGYRKKLAQKNEFQFLEKAQRLSLKYSKKPREDWSNLFKSLKPKNKILLDGEFATQWDKTE